MRGYIKSLKIVSVLGAQTCCFLGSNFLPSLIYFFKGKFNTSKKIKKVELIKISPTINVFLSDKTGNNILILKIEINTVNWIIPNRYII